MKIAILPSEDWPTLEPHMAAMGNAMPARESENLFMVALERDRLAGFLHIERVLHFNFVKIMEGFENRGLAPAIMREAIKSIPPGCPAIWLADRDCKDDLRLLAASLGARDVGMYRYYRRDGRV